MQPAYPPRFPVRSHPGGDDISARVLSIIRISRSVAGYTFRYPYMSDVPHRGTLTRPEQLRSPVWRALRNRQQERPRRLPSINKHRAPARPVLPIVLALSSDHQSGIPVPVFTREVVNTMGTRTPVLPAGGTQAATQTEPATTTAQDENESNEQIVDRQNESHNRGRGFTHTVMGFFAHPHRRYRKLLQRNQSAPRNPERGTGGKTDDSGNAEEAEDSNKAGAQAPAPVIIPPTPKRRRRNALFRFGRRVRKAVTRVFH